MILLFILLTAFTSAIIRLKGVEHKRHDISISYDYTSTEYGISSAIFSVFLFTITAILFWHPNFIGSPIIITAIFLGSVLGGNVLSHIFYQKARLINEGLFKGILWVSASFAFIVTIGIAISLFSKTFSFFEQYSLFDFIFGTVWSPQIALRVDQVGASGKFGMLPLLTGTLLITFIALVIAVPMGIGIATYLSEFASPKARFTIKPALEILAGIPTVVYGFFAAVTVAPFIKNLGASYDLAVSSESALAAGLVMGIMIIPYISSLTDDVLHAVPRSLRDGALALGATDYEMITKVVMPAAFPGIISAFILGFSRAIGETMIVLMAAGLAGNLTFNPLDSVTTFTVQIGTLLTGDQEFNSIKTLSAFALGTTLFILTFFLNIIAVRMIQKYKANYGY